MRLAHHLLRHPSGMWHFRVVVPRDLHAVLGLRIIKKSLGTHDPTAARAWAYMLSARYALIFAEARSKTMGKDSSGEREQNTRPLPREIKLRTGSGNEPVDYVCEIRADGSKRIEADGPDDHARAMAALAEMEKAPQSWPTSEPKSDVSALASAMKTLGVSLTQSRSVQTPVPTASRPRAMGLVADQWLKSIGNDTLKKTLTIKSAAVMGFARHVGMKKMLHEVVREDVHAWVEALRASGLQTPTLVNKCSYLRGFFNWAVQAGHYPKFPQDENPAMGHVIFRKREKMKRKALGFKPSPQTRSRPSTHPKHWPN